MRTKNTYVVAIIEKDRKVLIGKKRKTAGNYLSGEWHIPGGGVEEGESQKQALIREMKEETGLDISVKKLLAVGKGKDPKNTAYWYTCTVNGGTQKAGDDLVDIRFVSKYDVRSECGDHAVSLWPDEVKKYLIH